MSGKREEKSQAVPGAAGSVAAQSLLTATREEEAWDCHIDRTITELRKIYTERLLPVEQAYEYDVWKPSWFSQSITQKRPLVTFLGPFSSGKSTFINYLLQADYLLTGPQPVTDKFTVVMYGNRAQQIPGAVLLADSNLPFRELSQFGETFANGVAGLTVPHPLLRAVTLVDTPGVLEAAGNMRARRYDYVKVVRWFAEKSDLVFFLFDPTKLDAGAELRAIFTNAFKGLEGKIRIVLNKADTVKSQELLRVYGALFWNLSNLIHSTEPPRVYVSSFWNRDYRPQTNHELFTKEKDDLLYELIETVPLQSLDHRVTAVLRRAKDVLVWAVLCAAYRTRIPAVFGKDKAKATFYAQYPQIVKDLAARYRLSEKDFPEREEVKNYLTRVPSHKYPDTAKLLKHHWIGPLQAAMDKDLPALLGPIQQHAVVDPRDRKRTIAALRAYRVQAAAASSAGASGTPGVEAIQTSLQTSGGEAPAAPPVATAPAGGIASPQIALNAAAVQQAQMFAMMHVAPMREHQQHQHPMGSGGGGGEAAWQEAQPANSAGAAPWYHTDNTVKAG